MKSQTSLKYLLPLLLVFTAGPGELAGQMGPGMALCPQADPPTPGVDQRRLQRPGKDKARAGQAQRSRGRRGDPQRMRERLSAVKIWKITEYLDLSEEQAGKFFPRTQEHQKEADKLIQQRRRLYGDFQKKIDTGKISARDVDQYVDEVTRLDKAHIDLRTKHIKSLKDILTDEQLARFAIFNEHFRRQIGQHLRDELPPPEAHQPEGKE